MLPALGQPWHCQNHPVTNASVDPPAATLPPSLPCSSQGKYHIHDASDKEAGNGNHLHIVLLFCSLPRSHLPPPLPLPPTPSIPSRNGSPPYIRQHPLHPPMIILLMRLTTLLPMIFSRLPTTIMMSMMPRHSHPSQPLRPSTLSPSPATTSPHKLLPLPWTLAKFTPNMLTISGVEHMTKMATSSQIANET